MWDELSHSFPQYLSKKVWDLDPLHFQVFLIVFKKQHHLSDKDPDLDVSLSGTRSCRSLRLWVLGPPPPTTSLVSSPDGHVTSTSSGHGAVTRPSSVCIRQVKAEEMSCMLIRLSIEQSVWKAQCLSSFIFNLKRSCTLGVKSEY